jgi:hypothetical protein
MKFTTDTGNPKKEILESAEQTNRDGGGFAWTDGEYVYWEKGMHVTADYIDEQIKKKKIQLPIIVHFRISTHGGTNDQLCHPFPISAKNQEKDCELKGKDKEGVMFHNGVWRDYDDMAIELLKTRSDARLPELHNLSDSRVMAWLVKFYGINYLQLINEKVTVLTPKGIRTFGSGWTDVEGVECSNSSFHHKKVTMSNSYRYDDESWWSPSLNRWSYAQNPQITVLKTPTQETKKQESKEVSKETKKEETKEAKASITSGIFDDFHTFLEDNFGRIKAKKLDMDDHNIPQTSDDRKAFIEQYESYLTELELNGIEFDDYSYNEWLEEKIEREVKN